MGCWTTRPSSRPGADEEPFNPIEDDDLTILLFTAGTTGTPKGVMLAHQNFSEYVLNNVNPVEPEMEEKNLLTVPLYHIAGIQGLMAAVYGGRTLVIQRQFEPESWMRLVQEERVDRAMIVPTMLKQLMDHKKFPDYDLSSLQVVTYGAAPMPPRGHQARHRAPPRNPVHQRLRPDRVGRDHHHARTRRPRHRGLSRGNREAV